MEPSLCIIAFVDLAEFSEFADSASKSRKTRFKRYSQFFTDIFIYLLHDTRNIFYIRKYILKAKTHCSSEEKGLD